MVFVNPLLYVAHLAERQKQKVVPSESSLVRSLDGLQSHTSVTSVRLIVRSAQPLPAKATKAMDTAANGERIGGEWKKD
jgi:hypothetical protein